MAGNHYKSSTPPPKKHRDPILVGRSQEELQHQNQEYIGEKVRQAALKSLREGTMQHSLVRVGKDGKARFEKLQKRLQLEAKDLLNSAFIYGYTEVQERKIAIPDLRKKLESIITDDEALMFEIKECTLEIIFQSNLEDAKFIYLNLGIMLLHSRLINLEMDFTI